MTIKIDSNFPGGNIVVENIDGNNIFLHQELRDTPQDWFYWCFRLRDVTAKWLDFTFTKSRAIGVRGPAVSVDQGKTWRWLGSDCVQESNFIYPCPHGTNEVYLSFGMPYQELHWQYFIKGLSGNPAISVHQLCTTPQGRNVEYLLLGCLAREPLHRIVITCRHHCCEMMASYALEGLIQWIADDNNSEAEWLRQYVQFLIVPFVDKDGVENGDQGKGRQGRDHNRDYTEDSIYATTAAIRRLIPVWGKNRLSIGIDLHCPHIAGGYNELIYIVGSQNKQIAKEQRCFSDILEQLSDHSLPSYANNFLAFGTGWNNVENFVSGKSFASWFEALANVKLAMTLEIPYANASGTEVNQNSARAFGQPLAVAIARYLKTMTVVEIL